MNYKLIDWYLKAQSKILYTLIMFWVICLLVLSFTVRADTFTDLYDDPYNLLSGTGKTEQISLNPILIADIPPEIKITKTGIEKDLDITATYNGGVKICINASNSIKQTLSLSGKDITKYPIQTISGTEQNINNFDITNSNCIQIDNVEFALKMGWSSVLVNSTRGTDIVLPGIDIAISDNSLIIGYRYFIANSTLDGSVWTQSKPYFSGTYSPFGVLVNSSKGIITYWYDAISNGIGYANQSENNGISWTSKINSFPAINVARQSCKLDNNSIMQCCFTNQTTASIYYYNSSDFKTVQITDENDVFGTLLCDIAVNNDGSAYIVYVVDNQLRIASNKNNWVSNSIYDYTLVSGDTISIDVYDDMSYILTDTNNLLLLYSNNNQVTWNAKNLSTIFGYNQYRNYDLGIAKNKNVYIVADNATGVISGALSGYVYTNDSGSSFSPFNQFNNIADKGQVFRNFQIAKGNYPSFARPINTIHLVFKNNTKIFYTNISNGDYVGTSDTTKPSFSTIPYNSTTTNQSATITWTPSESANYTLRYTTTDDYTGGTLISNATSSASQRDVGIAPLVNYTSYYINVSIWDTSGNYNQSNFSFRTNQNVVVTDSCATCNILCSDNCVLTTNINCAAGAATVSGAGTLSGQRYLTNWQTLTINGGCVVQY